MKRKKVEMIKSDLFDRELGFGIYETTAEFRKIGLHSCVCFKDDLGVVAVTGLAGDLESEQYAELFSVAPQMLDALETMEKFWADPNFNDISVCVEKVRDVLNKIKQDHPKTED